MTFIIHTFAKEYKWSKSQIDEVYPEEATTLIKFIAFEKQDEVLQKKIDYYVLNMDKIHIAYSDDPAKVYKKFKEGLEKLQKYKIGVDDDDVSDDDLPDRARMAELKEFKRSH